MQSFFFWAACATALTTFCVHTFIGGIYVARPLLADQGLPPAAKWLAYYCWHLVTLMLGALALVFAAMAARSIASDIALALSIFCLCCSALSMAVATRGGIAPLRFPSTSLFAVVGLLGLAGATL
jgi:hypothetical protein